MPRQLRQNNRLKGELGLNWGDVGLAGLQLLGNIGSSLVNQNAINRLRFTPIHTRTVAEAPVKLNTTYDINPQLDRVREVVDATERDAINNSASSRTAFARRLGVRGLGINAYNQLYGNKLNQETAMLNADAQNRQGVYARNAHRLQTNWANDIRYNTQGEDNLRNTRTMLTSQNWTNAINQGVSTLANTYNRGQQRLQDANSLAYLLASNPDAMKFFYGNDMTGELTDEAKKLFDLARNRMGVGFRLGGKSSLIRKK